MLHFRKPTLAFMLLMAGTFDGFSATNGGQVNADAMDILRNVAKARAASDGGDYSETRNYSFHNGRFQKSGEMNVRAIHHRDSALQLEAVGSPQMDDVSRKVLRDVMDGEKELSRSDKDRALTPANYNATLAGRETVGDHECFVLELQPKRKSKFLLKGKAWIDAADFRLVRIQGRPSASLSMWVGKPLITQDFGEADGVWVQTKSHSVASTMFLGTAS